MKDNIDAFITRDKIRLTFLAVSGFATMQREIWHRDL